MLKDITIGQYVPGFRHPLDPRTKILAAIIFIFALFIVTDLAGYIVMTLFSVVIILLSQIRPALSYGA